jgi:hypothetical protein
MASSKVITSFEIFCNGRLQLSDGSSILKSYDCHPVMDPEHQNRYMQVFDLPFRVAAASGQIEVKKVAWRVENNVEVSGRKKTKMFIVFCYANGLYRAGAFETKKDVSVCFAISELPELNQREYNGSLYLDVFPFHTEEFKLTEKGLFIPSLTKTLFGVTSGEWKEALSLILLNQSRLVNEIYWNLTHREEHHNIMSLRLKGVNGSYHFLSISVDRKNNDIQKVLSHCYFYKYQEVQYLKNWYFLQIRHVQKTESSNTKTDDGKSENDNNSICVSSKSYGPVETVASISINNANVLYLNSHMFSPITLDRTYSVPGLLRTIQVLRFGDRIIEEIEWKRLNMLHVKIKFADGSVMSSFFNNLCQITNMTPKDFHFFENEEDFLTRQKDLFQDVWGSQSKEEKQVEPKTESSNPKTDQGKSENDDTSKGDNSICYSSKSDSPKGDSAKSDGPRIDETVASISITNANVLHLNSHMFSPMTLNGNYRVPNIFTKDRILRFGDRIIEEIHWKRRTVLHVKITFVDGSVMSSFFNGLCQITNMTPKDCYFFENEEAFLSRQKDIFPDVWLPSKEEKKVEFVESVSLSRNGELSLSGHTFAPEAVTNGDIFGETTEALIKEYHVVLKVMWHSVAKTVSKIYWSASSSAGVLLIKVFFTDKSFLSKEFRYFSGMTILSTLTEFDLVEKRVVKSKRDDPKELKGGVSKEFKGVVAKDLKIDFSKRDVSEKLVNEVEELLEQTKFTPLTTDQFLRVKQLIEIKELFTKSLFHLE